MINFTGGALKYKGTYIMTNQIAQIHPFHSSRRDTTPSETIIRLSNGEVITYNGSKTTDQVYNIYEIADKRGETIDLNA